MDGTGEDGSPPPDGFGSAEVCWRPSAAHDPIDIASLYFRHRVIAAVKTAWPTVFPKEEFSAANLVKKMGEEQKKVRPWQKRIAGKQTLSLADLLALVTLFGDEILAALPQRSDDLFPSDYAQMLRRWRPGSGHRPEFIDAESDSVDWQSMAAALADFDSGEITAGRAHLISADTYRYFFANVYGSAGGHVDQLELVPTQIDRCEAVVLYAARRLAALFADLRDPISRPDAMKALIRVIHEASVFDAHEKVAVVIAGTSAIGQLRALFPTVYSLPGEPFRLQLERTELAGPDVVDEVLSLENNEISLVGRAPSLSGGEILALLIHK
ncbi:hypothetical protein [Mycolicibacterium fluoranthenivorans]|uniref:Uncharacterized protein n=1 Tax=Mycolicibacterium fluoranthenivorans TaxID=258505 RepID=A0A1G4WKZ0_9MYCO|nr:hypothetical protein [Mycolicibacterium fluoranthenivorans]SCX24799.1 hypothetical protein SAMN02799620_03781 [Mycolicibacterium fluoranthenivorans]